MIIDSEKFAEGITMDQAREIYLAAFRREYGRDPEPGEYAYRDDSSTPPLDYIMNGPPEDDGPYLPEDHPYQENVDNTLEKLGLPRRPGRAYVYGKPRAVKAVEGDVPVPLAKPKRSKRPTLYAAYEGDRGTVALSVSEPLTLAVLGIVQEVLAGRRR